MAQFLYLLCQLSSQQISCQITQFKEVHIHLNLFRGPQCLNKQGKERNILRWTTLLPDYKFTNLPETDFSSGYLAPESTVSVELSLAFSSSSVYTSAEETQINRNKLQKAVVC